MSQFNLKEFEQTWQLSVPEGMQTSAYQLEVGTENIFHGAVHLFAILTQKDATEP